MIIGVPSEIKTHEYRVGLVPSSVQELTSKGHEVWIQSNAGVGAGFSDQEYLDVGAKITSTADEIWQSADMIVKVKEPQPSEFAKIRENQILFTYLHLAPDPEQAQALIKSKCVAIAYETITAEGRQLPLLAPMSEVAGRVAIQAAAASLERHRGGRGILLGGVPGVTPADVVIIGAGMVGVNAAKMAAGMGARVTILDLSVPRLREIDAEFHGRVQTLYANKYNVEQAIRKADVIVGAVLIPGGSAPKIVTKAMLSLLKKGCVMIDVAIDQGGCFETSRPTTHADPTFEVDGIIHYCVANMPGAVPRTSAQALNNATLPYVLRLAQKGYVQALREDEHFLNGLNVLHGCITHPLVARDLGLDYVDPLTLLD